MAYPSPSLKVALFRRRHTPKVGFKKRNAFPRRTSTGMNNEGKQMRYDPAILRGLAFIVGSKPRCTASKTKKRRVRTAMRKFTMALSAWHNCSWVTGNHWNQIQLPKKRFYTASFCSFHQFKNASFCSFHQFKNASFCSFHQKWSLSAQPWRNENVQMSSDDDVLYFSNSMNAMKVWKCSRPLQDYKQFFGQFPQK